ncbi:Pilus assembly protein PilO [Thioalkalivibrio sulfidiphilus HL-EbGr7]|uniref:Pilus assembly protein PilO n=1 Tax=Thioalkalivibrio sulfidiphilus (strain HL-EbGR7) TaxID=396588 RepID=B8GPU9_THISH|nr:type 4a pilus biogenesis protein PilO [Thioalkalivibrio sulfidiphilus]ACL74096.1 Pilus assembly protein PilO [Thioalkalivibrio sulfidiphilus HL-EbGr7]
MNLQDLNNIDLKTIGTAPAAVKGIAIAIVVIAILGVGYWFVIKDQLEQLDRVQAQETQLRQTFETRQRRAANLQAYKDQLEEMQRTFGTMLRQLPSRTEIPSLLVDISQTALASGLEIDLFRPQAEQRRGFYAEAPIQLRMHGSYEQMAEFTSGVASLPRIVTLHDVVIRPTQDGTRLTMEATAKTYRYLDETDG